MRWMLAGPRPSACPTSPWPRCSASWTAAASSQPTCRQVGLTRQGKPAAHSCTANCLPCCAPRLFLRWMSRAWLADRVARLPAATRACGLLQDQRDRGDSLLTARQPGHRARLRLRRHRVSDFRDCGHGSRTLGELLLRNPQALAAGPHQQSRGAGCGGAARPDAGAGAASVPRAKGRRRHPQERQRGAHRAQHSGT